MRGIAMFAGLRAAGPRSAMARATVAVAAVLCVGGTAAGCVSSGSAGQSTSSAQSTVLGAGSAVPVISAPEASASGNAAAGPSGGASTVAVAHTTNAPAAAPTTHPAAPPAGLECTDAHLKVGEQSAGDAGGHQGLLVTFKNTGSSACSLKGYPGASVELSGASQLSAQRSMQGYLGGDQSGQQSPSQVVIQPGVTVSALLEWEDFPQSGATTATTANCAGYGSTNLLVTAPGSFTSETIAVPPNVCWGFFVHPVVPVVANTWQ